jgi:hypothetical protein
MLARCATVVCMAYMGSPEERAKYLRRAEMAAAAALGNGCTPDEVRRAVETGIADELKLEAQRQAAQSGTPLPGPSEPPGSRVTTPALDAWASRFA